MFRPTYRKPTWFEICDGQRSVPFHEDINKCLAFYCLPQDIYPDYRQLKTPKPGTRLKLASNRRPFIPDFYLW